MTWLLRCAMAVVLVVGAIAAVVSYSHMQELADAAGEGWRSYLIPLSVDGLIVAAGMVLAVRRVMGLSGGPLAWGGLAVGVVASIAANMADARPEVTAVLVAGWAPVAFAWTFELIQQLRKLPALPDATDAPVTADRSASLPAQPSVPSRRPLSAPVTDRPGLRLTDWADAPEFGGLTDRPQQSGASRWQSPAPAPSTPANAASHRSNTQPEPVSSTRPGPRTEVPSSPVAAPGPRWVDGGAGPAPVTPKPSTWPPAGSGTPESTELHPRQSAANPPPSKRQGPQPTADQILEALDRHQGTIAELATTLQVSESSIYRAKRSRSNGHPVGAR